MSLRQESRYPWFEPRLVAAIVIATAIVWSTSIVAGAWKSSRSIDPQPQTVPVTETITRHLKPDHLTWSVTVRGRGDSEQVAGEQLHENLETVHAFLLAHDVLESEIVAKGPIVHDGAGGSSDEDGSATTPSDVIQTQILEITPKDLARGLRAQSESAFTTELGDADVDAPACAATGSEEIGKLLVSEARDRVYASAHESIAQYGGHAGALVAAAQGGVEITTSCTDIVVTATATATYQLE